MRQGWSSGFGRIWNTGVMGYCGIGVGGGKWYSGDGEKMVPDEKIAYSDTPQGPLLLHVFRPGEQGKKPLPAIIFFFGGGWRGGSPHQFYPHCTCLAAHGMIAISAEYRVKSRHNTTPRDSVADGRMALRWVIEHAAELGVDPDRLAVGGGSAGGHVALASILCDRIGPPLGNIMANLKCMVVFNPVADTTATGYGVDRVGPNPEFCSPLHNVRQRLPPTLIFHGADDTTIRLETIEALRDAARAAGSRCELAIHEDQGHGFFNFEQNPGIYETTLKQAIPFLSSVGMIAGEVAVDEEPGAMLRASVRLPAKSDLFVYLLIGQSNMAGRGAVEDQDRRPKLGVLSYDARNRWTPAIDPLHLDRPDVAGVGPGLTFGKIMQVGGIDAGRLTGLVPCAFGGTPLSRWEKTGDLYEGAVARCRAAMADGTLKGILWHQGESDAKHRELAETYGDRLVKMVADLRADLGCGDVPFVAGRLGPFLEGRESMPHFDLVDLQLAAVPERIPNAACVSTEGLTPKEDGLHFDTPSARDLGRRYAEALKRLTENL